jgi:hypothetical protein
VNKSDTLTYKHYSINVVKRPKRRSTTLQIDRNNSITIVAPWNIKERHILDVLNRNERWIERKLTENAKRPQRETHSLENGSQISYLGNTYTLQWTKGKRSTTLDNHHLTLSHPKEHELSRDDKQALLERWLKTKAEDIICDRVEIYAEKLGKRPKNVRFKKQKTRWGSCSSLGNLNFNYLLMMTSIEVIDYIVAHELCHLKHPNHSRAFWSCVEKIYPDYKKHHVWLRENGHLLSLDP